MTPEECKRIFAVLSEYIDGDLTADLCERIGQHLEHCPPCIEFLESLRKTAQLCKELPPDALAAPLSEDARLELEAAWRRAVEEK